jgi:hypothetical protein
VTWTATFSSDTGGIKVNWQWAAAAYTPAANFGDYNALNVKPVDDPNQSAIRNSDHAGTPELNRPFVTGGAMGGGGSNFTGSYSGTASLQVPVVTPNTLSGFVFNVTTGTPIGIGGVTLTLTGLTTGGQTVTMTTQTAADGSYSFAGLQAGTYTIVQTVPGNLTDTQTSPGTVNGHTDGTVPVQGTISQVALTFGNNGVNYNFGDVFAGS